MRLTWPLAAATASITTPPISWCWEPLIRPRLPPAGFGREREPAAGDGLRRVVDLLVRFFIAGPSWPRPYFASGLSRLDDHRLFVHQLLQWMGVGGSRWVGSGEDARRGWDSESSSPAHRVFLRFRGSRRLGRHLYHQAPDLVNRSERPAAEEIPPVEAAPRDAQHPGYRTSRPLKRLRRDGMVQDGQHQSRGMLHAIPFGNAPCRSRA